MVYDPMPAGAYPNLVNVTKRLDPDGKIAKIAELANATNRILDDAPYFEGNGTLKHVTTVRTGIPAGTWRRLNYGIQPQKSTTAQVEDSMGMLENRSEVDTELASINGNTAEFRLSEDRPVIEGLNQTQATTLFYGNTVTNPERFLGLAPRYDSLGTPTNKPSANNYLNQVIDGGGTGSDTTSAWLIVWGRETVHMVYPKGTKAGLEMQDLGEIDARDSDGNVFRAFATHYKMRAGLVVRDWRYVVRIANLESALSTTLDYKLWIQAINAIPNIGMGRPVFYMNRNIKTQLEIAAAEKSNMALSMGKDETFGKDIVHFWGVPCKLCDAILNTETALT